MRPAIKEQFRVRVEKYPQMKLPIYTTIFTREIYAKYYNNKYMYIGQQYMPNIWKLVKNMPVEIYITDDEWRSIHPKTEDELYDILIGIIEERNKKGGIELEQEPIKEEVYNAPPIVEEIKQEPEDVKVELGTINQPVENENDHYTPKLEVSDSTKPKDTFKKEIQEESEDDHQKLIITADPNIKINNSSTKQQYNNRQSRRNNKK